MFPKHILNTIAFKYKTSKEDKYSNIDMLLVDQLYASPIISCSGLYMLENILDSVLHTTFIGLFRMSSSQTIVFSCKIFLYNGFI